MRLEASYLGSRWKLTKLSNMEIWREIIGYEGLYAVSSSGSIKSLERMVNYRIAGTKRIVRERIRKPFLYKNGYYMITLWRGNVGKTETLHRIIASAFIPNPENKETVNHINGIKTDNSIDNLEWASYSENAKHAVVTGLNPTRSGEQLIHSKLNDIYVSEIRQMYKSGISIKEIHKSFNFVSITSIHNVCYNKCWIKSGLVNP